MERGRERAAREDAQAEAANEEAAPEIVTFDDGRIADRIDVFLSYDHEAAWRVADDAPRRVADALAAAGYSVWWDRGLLDEGLTSGAWPDQLRRNAQRARRVVTLETVRYFSRPWCLEEFELGLAGGALARFKLERDCAPMDALQARCGDIQCFDLSEKGASVGDAVVARLRESLEPARPKNLAKPLTNANIAALPTVQGGLVGRRAELDALREAWTSGVNVAVLHAVGGAGKTAILRRFADDVLDADRALSRAYAWSAYSQGSNTATHTDADGFIAAALTWFGGDPARHRDSVDQADALADLVAAQRALLLLDGLEPLQSPFSVNRGRLTSKALARLITRLADFNQGMLVVTSRQALPELQDRAKVLTRPLAQLSQGDGVALLRALGGIGRRDDLEAAVDAVSGHALSVRLLGAFAARMCGGDVARARETLSFAPLGDLSELTPDEQTNALAKRSERIAQETLARFEDLQSRGEGEAERVLLHVVGLFDRPADGDAVQALLKGPAIPGLTDPLFIELGLGEEGLTETALSAPKRRARWHWAKTRLRELGLLAAEDPDDTHGLDAHPVLRRYFRERLEQGDPDAWKAANLRLYEHYAAAAPDQPDTLDAMQPLLNAIPHGVAAGRVQEVFWEVYLRRLRRGGEHYIVRDLGAFDADLAALGAFFAEPWSTPRPALGDVAQSFALNYAAFALRAVGRLDAAVEPFQESSKRHETAGRLRNAALNAGNASELLLSLGRIAEARAWAASARGHAENLRADADDDSGLGLRMLALSQLGDAAHAEGDLAAAAALFANAEALQAEREPNLPRLYSLQGYRHGDLLLSQGRADAAFALARYQSALRGGLLTNAVHALLAARAAAALLRQAPSPPASTPPRAPLESADVVAQGFDDAVSKLRAAAADHHIPRGYIARAAFRRWRAETEPDARTEHKAAAARDLDLAFDIADYGGIRLFLADIALERAALALVAPVDALKVVGGRVDAQLAIAKSLIDACGYGRRAPILADLKQRRAAL